MVSIVSNTLNFKISTNLSGTSDNISTLIERLSTGSKINRAKDDAAGLFLGKKFTVQISGLNKAYDNTQQGVNLVKTADGALSNMNSILQRIRDLSLQSANSTYSDSERASMQEEANNLIAEMKRLEETTTFNKKKIFSVPSENTNNTDNTSTTGEVTEAEGEVAVSQSFTVESAKDSIIAKRRTLEEIEVEYAAAKESGNLVIIDSVAELDNVRNTASDANKVYVLMSDINLSGLDFAGLGNLQNFNGTFDGNGYSIKNWHRDATNSLGFLGDTNGAKIKNLIMENVNVSFKVGNCGIIVSSANAGTTISDCFVSGKMTDKGVDSEKPLNVGGICGTEKDSKIENCYSVATISGRSRTAGICGYAGNGSIIGCASAGEIKGLGDDAYFIAGIAGQVNAVTISGCFSNANITATSTAGGLVGTAQSTIISDCYSTGTVTTNKNAGGLLGRVSQFSKIDNCYTTSKVNCSTNSGAVIGDVTDKNFTITNTYWSKEKSGKENASGDDSKLPTTADIIQKDASFFKDSSNLSFLGSKYTYDYNPPVLKAMTEKPPDPPPPPPPPPPVDGKIAFQVGSNSGEDNLLEFDFSFSLGDFSVDISSSNAARTALDKIDSMMQTITEKRSDFGAMENRLLSSANSTQIRIENYSSSNSTIMDTDYAATSAALVKQNILKEASASLLSQTASLQQNLALALLQ